MLVEADGRSLLIDTTPELRLQCLACDVRRVDAVLFTHHHADHVMGLDDLRRFNAIQGTVLTCYGDEATVSTLERVFPYAFHHSPDYPSSKPNLRLELIEGPFEIDGVPITPIPLYHGKLHVFGFRLGRFAYCTDVSSIPDSSWPLLADLDVLVLDALRKRPHPTHFNLEQAVEIAGRINARRTVFTHIAHELAHDATNASLPTQMALGYDGQVIEVPA